jgi:hypothetical protein
MIANWIINIATHVVWNVAFKSMVTNMQTIPNCEVISGGFNVYSVGKVKVKVTLVQALRLSTGRTAHRGSRGIALPFHDLGTRRG